MGGGGYAGSQISFLKDEAGLTEEAVSKTKRNPHILYICLHENLSMYTINWYVTVHQQTARFSSTLLAIGSIPKLVHSLFFRLD